VSAHVLDRLSLYLDGELAAAARAEVEAHLRGCSACARHLEELAAVDAAARELPVPAPAGYFDSLPARVRARLPVPRRRTPPVWVWAAAAGVALAALTPLLFRQTASPVPEAMRTEEAGRVAAPPPTIAAAEPLEALPEGGERAKTRAAPKDAGQSKPGPTPAPLLYKKAQENAAAARPSTTGQIQRHNGPFAQAPAAGPPPQAPTPALASQPAARVDEARAGEPPEEAPARAAKEVQREAAVEGKLERDQAGAGVLSDSMEPAQARGEDARYRGLLARQPASADAARKLHDDWAAFAKAHPDGPRADEARVRALDALLSAYRRGGEARDLQRLRDEAALYLQRSDAAQAHRVRAMLESVN
jgi:putative zinc finger protein